MQHRTLLFQFGIASAVGLTGFFLNPIGWASSQSAGLMDQAKAEIGRPWTATSVAGVGRRVYRRQARRAYWGYGAGAVGLGGAYVASQYSNSAYDQNYYPGQYYGPTYSPYYAGQYPSSAATNYYYSGPGYMGSYASAAPPVTSARTVEWCATRYHTYDVATQTFIGNGGRRLSCP